MRNFLLLLIFLFNAALCSAQYPGYKPLLDMASFKKEFMLTAQNTQTIKSDFVQEKNLSMLNDKIISKGKFWFKKNNLVRIEYTQPFQYLMVMNQNNVYIKDGQKENKMSAKSNKLFQQINKITVDCIQGTALTNSDFNVKVFENNTAWLIEMSPVSKGLKDFFKNINITVTKKDYAVTKIDMIEPGGDNTVISFTNREINNSIPDAIFAIK
jgi:outer membrane lipoprotein-sorting protein